MDTDCVKLSSCSDNKFPVYQILPTDESIKSLRFLPTGNMLKAQKYRLLPLENTSAFKANG